MTEKYISIGSKTFSFDKRFVRKTDAKSYAESRRANRVNARVIAISSEGYKWAVYTRKGK